MVSQVNIWRKKRGVTIVFTLFRTRGFPQPSLSAAARLGHPARASESSADCTTWWNCWFPRPDELRPRGSVSPTSAVPRESCNAWPAASSPFCHSSSIMDHHSYHYQRVAR